MYILFNIYLSLFFMRTLINNIIYAQPLLNNSAITIGIRTLLRFQQEKLMLAHKLHDQWPLQEQ